MTVKHALTDTVSPPGSGGSGPFSARRPGHGRRHARQRRPRQHGAPRGRWALRSDSAPHAALPSVALRYTAPAHLAQLDDQHSTNVGTQGRCALQPHVHLVCSVAAGDAKLRPNQSECGLHRASSAHSHAAGPSLHDRFLSAAGGSGLHTSFSSTGPMGRVGVPPARHTLNAKVCTPHPMG